jgi:hypothetical protein
MSIVSPWLEVASVLVEILAHLTDIAKAPGEVLKSKPLIRPEELVRLRMHLFELSEVTQELARETHAGELSARYHELRDEWLHLFAPAHTVLHNVDPTALATLGIYAPCLASLLERTLHVTESALAEALKAEQEEISYDTNSHLCTLCLQMVRTWSTSKTMAGGLTELSTALSDTIVSLDQFVKSHWSVSQLSAIGHIDNFF